jgi:parallel beta-helix repeat protein
MAGALISESGGKLYSEIIDGRRIVYAGFDSSMDEFQSTDIIQQAIDYFKNNGFNDGGSVLVRSSTYSGRGIINVSAGISLYGGYDDHGNRDILNGRSVINGSFYAYGISGKTEIDGFDIKNIGGSGIYIGDSSDITIRNNTFGVEGTWGIKIEEDAGSIHIENNTIGSGSSLWAGDNIGDIYLTRNRFGMEGELYVGDLTFKSGTAYISGNIFERRGISLVDSGENSAIVYSENNNYIGGAVITNSLYLYASDSSQFNSTGDYIDSMYRLDGSGGYIIDSSLDMPAATAGPVFYNPMNNITTSPEGYKAITLFLLEGFVSGFYFYDSRPAYDYSLNLNDLYQKAAKNKSSDFAAIYDTNLALPFYILGAGSYEIAGFPNAEGTETNGSHTGYFDNLKYKLGISSEETVTLEEAISGLEKKESRTEMEERLLEAANLIQQNSQNLDADSIEEFAMVIRLVEVAQGMKGLIRDEDFQSISKALTRLVGEQRLLYSGYLDTTAKLYEKLAYLLGATIDDENLPDEYLSLARANSLAGKKIAADLALERLKTKEKDTLTDNEKEALRIDEELLRPEREEYAGKLKMAVTSFTWDVKETLSGKDNVAVSGDSSGLKALFILDYNRKPALTAKGAGAR